MKIKHLFLLLLLALCAPWAAQGQSIINCDPLTINNGASIFSAIPFKGDCLKLGTHSQFILPQASLASMRGGTVTKMSFYCFQNNVSFNDTTARFSVYMAEVPYDAFTSSNPVLADWDSMTQVYTGTVSINNSVMVIELDSLSHFTYYGGNLMIGFQEVQLGNNKLSGNSWKGVNTSSNKVAIASTINNAYYNTPTNSYKNFLPKMTFEYYVWDLPTVAVTIDDITSNTASFSWVAPSPEVTGYKCQYQKASEAFVDSWEVFPPTTTSVTFDGLDASTDYIFRIKACYNELESAMTIKDFRTACPTYATIPFFEDFESYEVDDNLKPTSRTLPGCWDYINTSTNAGDYQFPTIVSFSANSYAFAYNGSHNSLNFYIDKHLQSIQAHPQYAILPAMQNINRLRLKFYARAYNDFSFAAKFKVGVMEETETGPVFIPIGAENTATPTYQLFTFDFNGYEGPGEHIAIWVEVPSYYLYNYVFIDNVEVDEIPGFTIPIASHEGTEGGWYLISSPLADAINPENVSQLTNQNTNAGFDLYRFSPNPETSGFNWENWKQPGDHYHFNLEPGRGYLYANHIDVNLNFEGTPYDGNGEVTLQYNDAEYYGGWNLVGNPFSVPAYIGDRDYLRMNDEHSGFVAVTDGSPIGPMEGIFVHTESNDILTFSTTPTVNRGEQLSVNVSKVTRAGHNTTFDRAILRFGEGHRMPKFQLNEESAKIYIPQNGMDYAIVTAEEQGEMPINFSADENGTYTLSFSIENVEFSYLHLFDNKTGNDIDLLVPELVEGPVTYTFEATTTDYESRFKLVYATGSSIAGDSFTFLNSNGNFSIFGIEGEATLQVFDMMGRMLSTETFSGSIDKQLNVAPGVYFIRLLNGEDVKTQKIVVR